MRFCLFALGVLVALVVVACEGQVSSVPKAPPAGETLRAPAPPAASLSDVMESDSKASARHLLIQYEGAKRAPSTLLRSRIKAREMAESYLGQVTSGGQALVDLIKAHSDEPGAAETGGVVGIFRRGEMVEPFEDAVFELKVGELSGVVESSFGFHIIERIAVEEIGASHILIQYEGSRYAPGGLSRSVDEARRLAEELRALALTPGSDFSDLARQHSTCPSSSAGGDLGRFARGVMVPSFEEAAFKLSIEGVSDVVETPFGFHIIKRTF